MESGSWVGARSLDCGHESEEDAGGGAHEEGEDEYRSADVNLVHAREVGWKQSDEGLHSHGGHGEAKCASNECNEKALDEQLADEAGAGCSKGEADGDFALTGSGASKQQVRSVGAGDEKHH